jgi:sugar/nucleoside kinase (ribokinase family)
VVYAGDGRTVIPVPPIDHVADTTGAGDAFAAGYLTIGDAPVRASVDAGCQAAARLIISR